eukprot:scaffold7679_cov403-Prasinococcus_capsulatus_cf.AAC.6
MYAYTVRVCVPIDYDNTGCRLLGAPAVLPRLARGTTVPGTCPDAASAGSRTSPGHVPMSSSPPAAPCLARGLRQSWQDPPHPAQTGSHDTAYAT